MKKLIVLSTLMSLFSIAVIAQTASEQQPANAQVPAKTSADKKDAKSCSDRKKAKTACCAKKEAKSCSAADKAEAKKAEDQSAVQPDTKENVPVTK